MTATPDPIEQAVDDYIAMERDAERFRKWRAAQPKTPESCDEYVDALPPLQKATA
jgi:hypothetical protein